jgi:hypothetical protein
VGVAALVPHRMRLGLDLDDVAAQQELDAAILVVRIVVE